MPWSFVVSWLQSIPPYSSTAVPGMAAQPASALNAALHGHLRRRYQSPPLGWIALRPGIALVYDYGTCIMQVRSGQCITRDETVGMIVINMAQSAANGLEPARLAGMFGYFIVR